MTIGTNFDDMGFLDKIFDYGEVGRNKMRSGELPEYAQGLDLTNAEYNQIVTQQAAWDYQSREAEKAREWQENYYKEFQSPSAMVEQYKQAGLNPMAIAGKVGGNTPPSASAPSASSNFKPSGNQGFMADLLGVVQTILGLNQQQLTVDTQRANLKLEYDKMQHEKELEQMRLAESARQSDNRLNFDIQSFDKTYNLDLDKFLKSNELSEKQIEYIDAQIANLNADLLAKDIARQLSSVDLEIKKLDLKSALRAAGVGDRMFNILGYDPNFDWSYTEQALLDSFVKGQQVLNITKDNLESSANYIGSKIKDFFTTLFNYKLKGYEINNIIK